jgi:hypothetical protein
VAETAVKRLICCGFRRTGKAMGQMYQCWWMIYQEINVFPRFEYHMFYVLYPFVTYEYLLTLPHTTDPFSDQVGVAITSWTRIREVLGWNLGYPDTGFL